MREKRLAGISLDYEYNVALQAHDVPDFVLNLIELFSGDQTRHHSDRLVAPSHVDQVVSAPDLLEYALRMLDRF